MPGIAESGDIPQSDGGKNLDIEVLHWDNRLWGEIPADF